jgi:hypothetical protein
VAPQDGSGGQGPARQDQQGRCPSEHPGALAGSRGPEAGDPVEGWAQRKGIRPRLAGVFPRLPSEIQQLLSGHPDFDAITEWSAEPEAGVPFDNCGGEPANLDVLVIAEDGRGPLVIGVEAKADETFGQTVAGKRSSAQRALAESPRSRQLERLQGSSGPSPTSCAATTSSPSTAASSCPSRCSGASTACWSHQGGVLAEYEAKTAPAQPRALPAARHRDAASTTPRRSTCRG